MRTEGEKYSEMIELSFCFLSVRDYARIEGTIDPRHLDLGYLEEIDRMYPRF